VRDKRFTVLSHYRQQVRVGCSGWQYRHWGTSFYPQGVPQSRWFAHYATVFDTVEINNSFYRLPSADTFAKWRDLAPPRFLYAVKASRFLTHMKKLKDPDDPLIRLFENVRELGPRLGPVLYQLPPNFGINLERLEGFLSAIRSAARKTGLGMRSHHVVEFRDPSWYDERVFELLSRYGVAMCLHDMQGSATERRAIGPCAYVRFHQGTSKYSGRYDDRRLDAWAEWLVERIAEGLDVFAYFNNDTGGHAPRDAVRLRDRIDTRMTHTAAS
jgi:uncharacterized protein YecE (DUF72 family)